MAVETTENQARFNRFDVTKGCRGVENGGIKIRIKRKRDSPNAEWCVPQGVVLAGVDAGAEAGGGEAVTVVLVAVSLTKLWRIAR
jgi:hypothetical protein